MKRIDSIHFDYYRIFYYVAKYQSISTAANMLYLTQPTISRTIQQLEEEVGAKLFVRTKKGVYLTAEGNILYPHVAEAIEHLNKATQDLVNYFSGDSGSITMASTETSFHVCGSDYLNWFRHQNPNVSVNIRLAHTMECIELVRNGLADFALITGPISITNERLNSTPLKSFQDLMVGSEKYRFLQGEKQSEEKLSEYPFITVKLYMVDEHYLKQVTQFYFNVTGTTQPIINVSNFFMAKSLIQKGLGIGALPEPLIRQELNEGTLYRIPLESEMRERQIFLLTCPEHQIPAISKKFIEQMIPYFKG